MFLDKHGDDGSYLRRESSYLLDGFDKPANDFQVGVLQEAEVPWVDPLPGPSCGAAETTAGFAQLVGRVFARSSPCRGT